jgi:putative hydrolase of HD superfamily
MSSPESILQFLNIIGRLKTLKRTGWVRSGIELPESDSDHMHRAAICAMLIPDSLSDGTIVDKNKCIKMALTHDVCEAIVGDFTPHDPISKADKHALEKQAMEEIRDLLCGNPLGQELYDLFMEYEEGETVESRFVKDIDKFEMLVQADEYERSQKKNLEQFFDHTKGYFTTDLFKTLDEQLRKHREEDRLNKKI